VDVVIRKSLGEFPRSLEFKPNYLMVRHYSNIFMQEEDWSPRKSFTADE